MFFGLLLFVALGAPDQPRVADPSEVLALTEDMKSFLDERIHPRTPPAEKMRQIVRLIFDDDELGFQYDKTRTKTAAETFHERSGNCLSFSLLFIAMARYVGVDVHFQQVDVPPSWDKHGDIVVATQHVNVISDIEGVRYEVDLAASVSRLKLGSRVVPDERGLANFFSNRAVDYLGANDPQMALEYLHRALEVDPSAGFAWSNLGVVQSTMGHYQEAEASYRQALKLEKDRLSTMDNLAKLCRKMGKHAEAMELSKKIEKYRNKNPFYHFYLGRVAMEAGEAREAVDHFKQAIKRRSEDDSFYFALAKAYAKLGEWDKVEESLHDAQKHAQDDSNRIRYDQKLKWLEARQSLQAQASLR